MEVNLLIFNCDCLQYMKSMKDCSVDCIVTDPPYLTNYKTCYRKDKTHRANFTIANDNNSDFIINYINECYRILKDNSAMFMFCSSHHVGWFKEQIEKASFNWKNTIIWVKNNWSAGDLQAGLGRQYECIILAHKGRCLRKNNYRYTDVWEFDRVAGKEQLHQNQKPIDLLERCLELYTSEHDIVFDGCMGSGSTGVACNNMNREFIGIELEKEFFDIAKKRIDNLD